ncbi:NAD(P)/FAD-dependent oxidoreductase [Kitasatospora sp. NPDC059803]|uniref:NAD(P)/FAD-dependent oxidoreductase n=1 Tax=Kitasatospora sp. NPDC059803 TaxID=3346953 RepID=UPI003656E9B6
MATALHLQRGLRERLRRGEVEITVVEPQAYFTYHPLLAEVAAGSIDPRHVVVPLRRALPDCRVLTARITRIEHAARRAFADAAGPGEAAAPIELPYDVLVVAPGSVSRTAPVPGLAEHGRGFSTVGEAVGLRNHVLEQLDLASATRDPALRQAALTFVFVGAGYAGVGALAELEDMARTAVRGYHNVRPEDLRWVLVEATDRILAEESRGGGGGPPPPPPPPPGPPPPGGGGGPPPTPAPPTANAASTSGCAPPWRPPPTGSSPCPTAAASVPAPWSGRPG